eukprot:snap_masked-scaffold_4-processed-gene-15.16-mRNA-1 protein AED:1.00 eAED:1.00 QI:0/-1/0/0/-1/1/1/0/373
MAQTTGDEVIEGVRVRISYITYNVLSSHFSSPKQHVNAKAEDLNPETRLQKLLTVLEKNIEDRINCIFCLQEVSELWSSKLSVFFEKLNYFCYSRNYAGDRSGFMGVLIAFPREAFSLEDFSSKRVSDTVFWPDEEEFDDKFLKSYSDKTLKSILKAKRRYNSCLWVRLRCIETNKEFCAATYHMPMMFWDKKVVDIHAGLLLKYVQRKSEGLPLILGGDFNLQPETPTYKYITSGEWIEARPIPHLLQNQKNSRVIRYPEENTTRNQKKQKKYLKEIREDSNISAVGEEGLEPDIYLMQSVYLEQNGAEPELTNSGASKNKFKGCLDYIFYSDLELLDVQDITENVKDGQNNVFPNENELSDHILLGCTFIL